MRIAVVHKDRCHPGKCGTECILYCPRVRTGDETIIIGDEKIAVISEELCVGCGICVKKCPFGAIDIVSLPEELEHPTHRYGKNGFALYGMATPVEGKVTGILGANGIGKSTAVKILSGQIVPNLGDTEGEASWEEILKIFAGTELYDYLRMVSEDRIKAALKPQYIDYIPKTFKGKVRDLLISTDERGMSEYYVKKLNITQILERNISDLSGGELQRVAIAACLSKDADFYFLDEITPYLDIYQRIAVAGLVRELAESRPVIIVEHDLAILDMLADTVNIAYGKPSYLTEENVRFRDHTVTFEMRAHTRKIEREVLMEFPRLVKNYEQFSLKVNGGEIKCGEVLGLVGANGIGKSTFARLIAGVEKPDEGEIDTKVRIAYKPQY